MTNKQALDALDLIWEKYPLIPQNIIDAINIIRAALTLATEAEQLRKQLEKAKEGLLYYAVNHPNPNDGAFGTGSTDFGMVAQKTLEALDA